jgi:hypothetical protein
MRGHYYEDSKHPIHIPIFIGVIFTILFLRDPTLLHLIVCVIAWFIFVFTQRKLKDIIDDTNIITKTETVLSNKQKRRLKWERKNAPFILK